MVTVENLAHSLDFNNGLNNILLSNIMVRLLILLAVTTAVIAIPKQTPVIGIYTQDAPSTR